MSASFRRRNPSSIHDSKQQQQPTTTTTSSSSNHLRSFRRYVGCKPWTGGYTLTSTGLREWDQMICNGGGGQPLQTCMIIEEDRWTCDLALSLTRYWSAEAISQNQILMMVAMRDDDVDNDDDVEEKFDDLDDDDLDDDDEEEDWKMGGWSPLDCQEFIQHRLPFNLHWEKEEKKRRQQQQQSIPEIKEEDKEDFRHVPISNTAILEEEEEEEDYDEEESSDTIQQSADDGLINAWQYKLSIQQERLGLKQVTTTTTHKQEQQQQPTHNNNNNNNNNSQSSGGGVVYCHSYDLSSNMKSKQHNLFQDRRIRIVNCSVVHTKSKKISIMEAGIQFYQSCLKHIQQELEKNNTTQSHGQQQDVIRLFIPNAIIPILSIALPLLLSYIRQHDLPVVMVITTRPWLLLPSSPSGGGGCIHYGQLLNRSADAVLSCQSFASNTSHVPSEFSNLMGLLFVSKMSFLLLPSLTSTSATFLQANRFGFKRNRRKMEITMLHLPPEEFSSNAGGGGLRKSKPSNDNSTTTNNNSFPKKSIPKKTTGFVRAKKHNPNLPSTTTPLKDAASLLDF